MSIVGTTPKAQHATSQAAYGASRMHAKLCTFMTVHTSNASAICEGLAGQLIVTMPTILYHSTAFDHSIACKAQHGTLTSMSAREDPSS